MKLLFLTILLLLSLATESYSAVTYQNKSNKDLDSVQNFSNKSSLQKLVKRVNFNKEKVSEVKDILLDNKIFVFGLWEPVSYSKNIDWNENPYGNRSWYLYLQSLRMIGYLAEDYCYSVDLKNIEKSKEIIQSWYSTYENDFSTSSRLSGKIWNDHAVANRTLNLMHAYFTFKNEDKLRNDILEILKFHGEWLYDDKNYTQGNHAVMIDRALFQLSQLFNFKESKSWQNKSEERLIKIFKKEITSEGVCTENSSSYHLYVLDLLIEIKELFKAYDVNYTDEWDQKIVLMKKFADSFLKPDNTLPIIGDTYFSNNHLNLFDKYEEDFLLYNSTFGKKGSNFSSQYENYVYPQSGYYFFKEKYISDSIVGFKNRTYLSLINTNLSPVHKHNDFLSITLTSNGEDLITDTGHLGYEKNKITEFTRQTFAHSGITVNNLNLNFKKIKPEDAKIDTYEVKDQYSMVSARVKFQEFVLKRRIYTISPNIFILYDSAFSNKDDDIYLQQVFNLGSNFSDLEFSDKVAALSFEKNKLELTQVIEAKSFKLMKSNISNSNFIGVNTKGYDKAENGNTLIYQTSKNRRPELLSILEIKNKNYKTKDVFVTEENNVFKVYVNEILLLEIPRY